MGIKEGLKLARSLGIERLSVDVDSSMAVFLLRKTVGISRHSFAHLIADIQSIMSSFEYIVIRHVWREGNHCADKLANLAQKCAHGVLALTYPPAEILPLLQADKLGILFLRP